MAVKGSKITHWSTREQKLLWALARKGDLTWEQIAQKVSAVGRTHRTAASCAQFYKVRLATLKRFPKHGVVRAAGDGTPVRVTNARTPVQTTVTYTTDAPGPVLVVIDGHVTRVTTKRSPAELLGFLAGERKKATTPAASTRPEEDTHGSGSAVAGN